MLKEILKNQKNKISRWKARFRKRVKERILDSPIIYVLAAVASFALPFGIKRSTISEDSSNQIDKGNLVHLVANVRTADDLNRQVGFYDNVDSDVGFYVKDRDGISVLAVKKNGVEYTYENVKEIYDEFYDFYKHYYENQRYNEERGYPDWEPYPVAGTWDSNGMGFVGFVKSASERGSFNKVLVSYSTEDMVKAKQEEPMQIIKNYGERKR